MIIAIDGPAGSGKSTVARRVAIQLGFQLIDTGAIYRAVAYESKRRGVDTKAPRAVAAVADDLDFEFRMEEGTNVLYCNGEGLGDEIRTQEISQLTSRISSFPAVREALLDVQRDLGRARSSVLEGRDIGTVVFPDADVKVFLSASREERARRRYEQIVGRGEDADFDAILAEIEQRDKRDSERDAAPLRKADDAVDIDSTNLSIEEVVDCVLDVAAERKSKKATE